MQTPRAKVLIVGSGARCGQLGLDTVLADGHARAPFVERAEGLQPSAMPWVG